MIAGEHGRGWRLSAVGVALVCVLAAAIVLFVAGHEWFHTDEWDFTARRVGPHPPDSVWPPHNEHPVVIPILAWRALFALVGLRTYLPYLGLLIAAHLALVVAVWVVARRAGAGPVAALGAASVLALCGAGQQNMLSAFQISFVGSVLATWWGTLLADRTGPPGFLPRTTGELLRLLATWAVLIAGLGCSLVSLPLMVLPAGVALARRGFRFALVTVGGPAAAFAVYFLRVGRNSPAGHPRPDLAGIPAYFGHGISSVFGSPIGLPWSGVTALTLVLAAVAVRARRLDRQAPDVPAITGLATAAFYFGFVSIGRTDLGADQAGTSRYVYIGVALVAPGCAALASRAHRWLRERSAAPSGRLRRLVAIETALLTGVSVLAVVGIDTRGTVLLLRQRDPITAGSTNVRAQFGVALRLLDAGQGLLSAASVNPAMGSVTAPAVLRLRAEQAFGTIPVADAATRARAELRLQVALLPQSASGVLWTNRRSGVGGAATEPIVNPWTIAVFVKGNRPVPDHPLRLLSVIDGSVGPASRAGCLRIVPRGHAATVQLATPTGGGQARLDGLLPAQSLLTLETGRSGVGGRDARHLFRSYAPSYRLVSTASSARLLLTVHRSILVCGVTR